MYRLSHLNLVLFLIKYFVSLKSLANVRRIFVTAKAFYHLFSRYFVSVCFSDRKILIHFRKILRLMVSLSTFFEYCDIYMYEEDVFIYKRESYGVKISRKDHPKSLHI